MKLGNIAVHIEAEHTCGCMHKTIFHVKDPKFEAHTSTEPIVFGPVRSDEFTLPTTPKTKSSLELSGSFDRIELSTCPCGRPGRLARMKQWLLRLIRQHREEEEDE